MITESDIGKYVVLDEGVVPFHEVYREKIQHVIPISVFDENRTKQIHLLDAEVVEQLRKARQTVPDIEKGMILQKVVAPSVIERYLGKFEHQVKSLEGTTGFVTKWQDADGLTPKEYIVELALTYRNSEFFNGHLSGLADVSNPEHLVHIVDKVYLIRTKSVRTSYDDEFFRIPFGTKEGVADPEKIESYLRENEPCTGNGFTSGPHRVIPEFYIRYIADRELAQPYCEDDEIYEVTANSIERIAYYDSFEKKWILG